MTNGGCGCGCGRDVTARVVGGRMAWRAEFHTHIRGSRPGRLFSPLFGLLLGPGDATVGVGGWAVGVVREESAESAGGCCMT
jgi:hypothetical protein